MNWIASPKIFSTSENVTLVLHSCPLFAVNQTHLFIGEVCVNNRLPAHTRNLPSSFLKDFPQLLVTSPLCTRAYHGSHGINAEGSQDFGARDLPHTHIKGWQNTQSILRGTSMFSLYETLGRGEGLKLITVQIYLRSDLLWRSVWMLKSLIESPQALTTLFSHTSAKFKPVLRNFCIQLGANADGKLCDFASWSSPMRAI